MSRFGPLAALGALAAALVAVPAAGQSEALLDCTTVAVTPAFRQRVADAMLGEVQEGASDAIIEELANVSRQCAQRNGLSEGRGEAYFSYSIARLPRDAFLVRLGDLGVPAQVVDDALDLGPGRSNPVITGALSQGQLQALVAALSRSGVDTARLEDSTWEMIGAYAAAHSLMWQALRKLR